MGNPTFRCTRCGKRYYTIDELHDHINADRKGLHKKLSSRNTLKLKIEGLQH